MKTTGTTRRGFMLSGAAAALASAVVAQTQASASGIPTRPLGRTGVRVSLLGLGGAHVGRVQPEAEAVRMIHAAIDQGITFMDNAWEYNKGRSEEVMGKAFLAPSYRDKAFLMTKVCSREAKGITEQLEESLRRLNTDRIDLIQFHECNYHNDPDWLVERGALKALLDARQQGKVRFIGFTGHKSPAIHNRMLALGVKWDACQMPNNVMDAGFLSFRHETMPVCLEKNIGIIGMKGCCGDGKLIAAGLATVEECYRYCLSQPVSTQVVGLTSMEMLETALRIGRSFEPLTQEEHQGLITRLREPRGDGRYELFKTSKQYDSAYHRTQHGFNVQGT
ncbi:MAG TPA: aldo/keto reductase [Bryobacteraceae bacterium]|nr:aldo/keto reductase [Bryobacteraceae bacterium]HPT26810.1 aldo/keto reductase [Bryobacteraceae bacterium]